MPRCRQPLLLYEVSSSFELVWKVIIYLITYRGAAPSFRYRFYMPDLCSRISPGISAASPCSLFWGRRTVISVSVTAIQLSRYMPSLGKEWKRVFFRVLPKIYPSTYSQWERSFWEVFSEIFTISLHTPQWETLGSCFQISPQRVASEKWQNVRLWWNTFSLHLFPVGKAVWRGACKFFFPQWVDHEKG